MTPGDWLQRLLALYAAGAGCYPARMGLTAAEWQALVRRLAWRDNPPDEAWVLRRQLMAELIAPRAEEQAQLSGWLALHMVPHAAPMHRIIASVSLAFNHLWQDLGLDSRAELRLLMTDCFPELVALNQHNMRWKKFFYRQRCLHSAGEVVCRSPSCDACCERAQCFAPEH